MQRMNQLYKIFEILGRDCAFWIPDFSNDLRPLDQDGKFISDTESGFQYYCEWLTDYLTKNLIEVSPYQSPIIKRLRRRKELSNAYILGNAGISEYYLFESGIEKYPLDFLDDPNPNRLKKEELNTFKKNFDIPKFRGLDANENLQASLVFEFLSIKQNKLNAMIEGPKWLDIGWRPILKEGLQTVNGRKEKVIFTKNFINEIAYLISK